MKQFLLIGFLTLSACGHSGSHVAQTNETITWHSAILTDLPDSPKVSLGEGEQNDYIQFRQGSVQKTYQVVNRNDHNPVLVEIPNAFEIEDTESIRIQARPSEVQKFIRMNYYNHVDRCRYSSVWRRLASVDPREQGPLLLKLSKLHLNRFWDVAFAIDQKSFQIVGTSLLWQEFFDSDKYVSTIEGENYISGVKTNSTLTPSYFAGLCATAYHDTFFGVSAPFPKNGYPSIDPYKEKEISKYLDSLATIRKTDLFRLSDSPVSAAFAVEEAKSLRTMPDDPTIEKLINSARKGQGVGL